MHSNECSRIDNNDKVPAIVDLGLCPQTGARIYDLHERRELLFDDNEILDELTGRNWYDKTQPNRPHPTWAEVVRSTTTEARPNGIKGSTKLIRQCKCPCMKRMKASVCSCSICERARESLRRYHKYRVGWRQQAMLSRKKAVIEQKSAEGMPEKNIKEYLDNHPELLQCQQCKGGCCEGSVYQSFSVSLSTCMNALLCEKVRIEELDMPKLDVNFREVPGEVDAFEIHQEDCCYGMHYGLDRSGPSATKFRQCGWNATFKDIALQERTEIDQVHGESIIHRVRVCPDEYAQKGKVTWMDFIKVARSEEKGSDEDEDYGAGDGVKFQTEWLPVEGSVPEFFEHLLRSIDAYLPHKYELNLSHRVEKRAERAFIVDPVIREDCPEEYKDTVLEVVDFSSDIHAKRSHDLTCSFPETHKCEVHHLTFQPKFVTVDEIEQHHPRSAKRLRNRGVDRVLRPENVVVYCFSKAKASAAYNQQATKNIISIIKKGQLPEDSKCEAFIERKRVPGGIRDGFPSLREGMLFDCDSMEPLYSRVKRWRRSRDGCGAQYQGKGAFRAWQTMKARHGMDFEDKRKRAMHGKDVADGDGSAVSGMVKNSFHDDYGSGTQNLVRHLAHKYPRPNLERRNRYFGDRGLYATTKYIYMYIPEDAIDERVVSVEEGYRGSSKDHYYRSVGATEIASRLLRRERGCGCDQCFKLKEGCLLTPASCYKAGTTPRATSKVLRSARPEPAGRQTRNSRNPLPEFCRNLKLGENVVVRVSNGEREDNPNENYFVAKIEEKAKQLSEAGTYSAVHFKKNDWIVFVRWFIFVPSKTNRRNDRFYSKGYPQWIPCGSIIQTIEQPVTMRWTGQHYQLSSELNDYIEEHGDISY